MVYAVYGVAWLRVFLGQKHLAGLAESLSWGSELELV
jgi:hypothetical protein